VLKDKGELRSALMSFRVALKLSDQAGDKLGVVASALLTGSSLDGITPGTPEALHYWKLALNACKELDPKVRRSLPLRSEALFRIVQHYESHKLYTVALPHRQELAQMMFDAKLPRGHATALLDVAEVLARVGRSAEAASTYAEVVTLWKALGEPVYEATARVGLARAMLHQARMHDARVEAQAAQALLLATPSKPRSEYNMARSRALAGVADVLARTGQLQAAHKLATAALATAEGPIGGGRDADAACEARLALARVLMEEGMLEEARKRATEALTHAIGVHHQPLIHAGLEVLGDLALRSGQLDKAEEYFSKLAKFEETRVSAMQHLAALAERRSNTKLAIRLHMDAVAASQDQPQLAFRSLSALSRLYEEQGNTTQAQTYKLLCANRVRDKT
jgi:tetratricopeptide (TPR) repeat protein